LGVPLPRPESGCACVRIHKVGRVLSITTPAENAVRRRSKHGFAALPSLPARRLDAHPQTAVHHLVCRSSLEAEPVKGRPNRQAVGSDEPRACAFGAFGRGALGRHGSALR
jgi:hypothetical protein